MIDFESKLYKAARGIIENKREQNCSWEDIENLNFLGNFGLDEKLALISLMVGDITIDLWREIVLNEKNEEENGMKVDIVICPPVTIPDDSKNDNNYVLDTREGSAWVSYKRTLKENNFDLDDIHSIQEASHKILNKLSLDTRESGPVKGLVIGSVQSGKTANMAALMAMAADQGWNMFIILSGTIENLRLQTQARLISDLNSATNVSWTPIDNVSTSPHYINGLSNLSLGNGAKQRYLMVCLKNSTRLKNLLNWMANDTKNRENLKILFIDDEADQAGVNTASANKKDPNGDIERTKINKSLVNFFMNKNGKGETVSTSVRALDYVAYTATPYANILNEPPSKESIYPSNFVACLKTSNKYFGPQQIFGIEGTDCDGLTIVNTISENELDKIKSMSSNDSTLPNGLEESILWFYCCLATQRVRKINKPCSMLIHTSQKQIDHERIAGAIKKWFMSFDVLGFVKKCKETYEKQRNKISKEEFYCSYPNYKNKDINDYLSFESISDEIASIFKHGLNSIKIDEDQVVSYTKGVHLCIDNCSHNFIENGEHIRLLYPDKKHQLDYASGFIVVGGATLSRGLTIEGLVSTYFLRTVKQADTLMQMGRWFGYRNGYELYQRIWLTDNTISQFKFLSVLDYELRNEMLDMQESGLSPSMVGIKVKVYPKRSFLEITSKNKSKSAIVTDMDFTGVASQTTIFYDDEKKLHENLINTKDFIGKLGKPSDLTEHIKANNYIWWENSNKDLVMEYISSLAFPKNDTTFMDVKLFKDWYSKIAEKNGINKWNVVVAGLDNPNPSNQLKIGELNICKVNRSKKKTLNDGLIRIGALRAPKDWYVDVNPNASGLDISDKRSIEKSATDSYKKVRRNAGLGDTSLLVIYFIDKNSIPKKGEHNRVPMGTKDDVVGISIVIPDNGKTVKGNYVSVDLSKTIEFLERTDNNDAN